MPDDTTIAPHGGELVDLLVPEGRRDATRAEADHLPKLVVNARELSDLEMLAVGALSPLTGFVGEDDYVSVLETMHLSNGLAWSIPVTLSLTDDDVKRIGAGSSVALLRLRGCGPDRDRRRRRGVQARPPEGGARRVRDRGPRAPRRAGAPRRRRLLPRRRRSGCSRLPEHDDFLSYRLTPAQTRAAFAERGWRTVVGFQTRNPIHRAHEYLQKCALEIVDGLLVHPLVGATKGDDVPADVRMRCYEALFEGYYPKDRAMVSVFPAAMRYAGPREAIWHAICRKNYGCTHFIVGRDHAGVGSYYGTYDAQKIFEEFEPGELGILPLMFEHSFWCNACEGMASPKTCPHGEDERVSLSGTKVREMLRAGERPPIEFSRPEVADILIDAMRER